MPYQSLTKLDLAESTKVVFNSRNQALYPQLTRLTTYFDLRALQLHPKAFSHISKRYLPLAPIFVLGDIHYQKKFTTYSPQFTSLEELEQFSNQEHINILHQLLSNDYVTKA
jgi:hypothetical protein